MYHILQAGIVAILIETMLLSMQYNVFSQSLKSNRFQIDNVKTSVSSTTEELLKYKEPHLEAPKNISADTPKTNNVRFGYPFSNEEQSVLGRISNASLTFAVEPRSSATDETFISYTGASPAYTITITQSEDLKKKSGETIPATTCDDRCTPSFANLWTSDSVYGLGYTLTGNDIPSDIKSDSYFRPMIRSDESGTTPVIMESSDAYQSRTAHLQLKLIPPTSSPIGSYEHIITITILPGY